MPATTWDYTFVIESPSNYGYISSTNIFAITNLGSVKSKNGEKPPIKLGSGVEG